MSLTLNVLCCLFQTGVSIEKDVWLYSTNSNGFVTVKGKIVQSNGRKTDKSGKFQTYR